MSPSCKGRHRPGRRRVAGGGLLPGNKKKNKTKNRRAFRYYLPETSRKKTHRQGSSPFRTTQGRARKITMGNPLFPRDGLEEGKGGRRIEGQRGALHHAPRTPGEKAFQPTLVRTERRRLRLLMKASASPSQEK